MAIQLSRKKRERRKGASQLWVLLCAIFLCFSGTEATKARTLGATRELPSTQRQLRGRPPKHPDSTAPTVPDITGAFELEVKLRLDAFDPYNGYNTIFNWSNGGLQDAIFLGVFQNPNVISLLIYKNGQWNGVSAYDIVEEGKEMVFTVGVDLDGVAWIDADGVRVATAAAVVPDNVKRNQLFLGSSDFWNTRPINGAILGLRITNKDADERDPLRRQFLQNLPGQFLSSFESSVYVQMDDASAQRDQGIADLYSLEGQDNVRIVCNNGSMRFDLYQDNTLYSVTADNSVTSGEMARWTIGVDGSNTMYLQKNDSRLASTSLPRLAKVLRLQAAFGNLASGSAPLDGVVLGFRTQVVSSAS